MEMKDLKSFFVIFWDERIKKSIIVLDGICEQTSPNEDVNQTMCTFGHVRILCCVYSGDK